MKTHLAAFLLLAAVLTGIAFRAPAVSDKQPKSVPVTAPPETTPIYGVTNQSLFLNSGPGTKKFFWEMGKFNSKAGETVHILAKAWDPNNKIWWIKVEYPAHSGNTGWTGYKRFKASSFNLDDVPEEYWYDDSDHRGSTGSPEPSETETISPSPELTPTPTPTPTPVVLKPGDHLTFGHYPQTEYGEYSEIEWRVLDVQDGQALVISEYGLDAQPYNTDYVDITWAKCSLRKWLNSTFLNKAFSSRIQGAIVSSSVDNSQAQGNPSYSTDGGRSTTDKIFLLSYAEAKKYFGTDSERVCIPTGYALKQSSSAAEGEAPACRWWLRSAGIYCLDASQVLESGFLGSYDLVHCTDGIVRPALWIKTDAGAGIF